MKTKLPLSVLLLTLFFCFEKGMAQAPAWAWARGASSINGADVGESIASDSKGNIYVAGSFSCPSITFGCITLQGPSTLTWKKLFIVKYDASGNVLWAKTAGEPTGLVHGYGIAVDRNGNVFVTGSFGITPVINFDTITLTNVGMVSQFFIVKLDVSGNALWAKSAGTNNYDLGKSVAVDNNGNCYVTGTFGGDSITFDSITLYNSGSTNSDIFIVKYDSSGNVLWAKKAGGSGDELANGIGLDSSGNCYLTGWFRSQVIYFDSITLTTLGNHDVFTAKYDSQGNVLWAKSGGGPATSSINEGSGIAVSANGNAYVTGPFDGNIIFDTDTLNSLNGFGVFAVLYDSSGTMIRLKKITDVTYQPFRIKVVTNTDGTSFIAGYYSDSSIVFDNDTLLSSGEYDVFITKYDSAFNLIWAKNTGGTGLDYLMDIAGGANGNLCATGYFTSPVISFDTDTIINSDTTITSSADLYIAKLLNLNSSFFTINPTACIGYTSPSGNYNWTTSGIYADTLISSIGCDSIITINLTIYNASSSFQADTACNSYTSPSGNYDWASSGIYTDTIPNAIGCDSIITINLTINNADTSVTQIDNTLTSNAIAATYQWLDCNSSYAPITGATSQIFTPLVDGNYAVAVTQNGCTDTSSCYNILGTGINENAYANGFSVIPNPATDYLTINTNSNKNQVITISDIAGKIIYSTTTLANKTIINTKDFQQGVYAVQVKAEDAVQTRKIVVTR